MPRPADTRVVLRQNVQRSVMTMPSSVHSGMSTFQQQGSVNLNLLRHVPYQLNVRNHSRGLSVDTEPKNISSSDSRLAVVNSVDESDPIEDRPLASLARRSKSTNNMPSNNTNNIASLNYQASEKQLHVYRLGNPNNNSTENYKKDNETTTGTSTQQEPSAEGSANKQDLPGSNIQNPLSATQTLELNQNHGQASGIQTKNDINNAGVEVNLKLQTNSIHSRSLNEIPQHTTSNSPRMEQNITSLVPPGNSLQMVTGRTSGRGEERDKRIDSNQNVSQIENLIVDSVGRDIASPINDMCNLKYIHKMVENINNKKDDIIGRIDAKRNHKRFVLQNFDSKTKSLISDLEKRGGSKYDKSKLIQARSGEKSRLAQHLNDEFEKLQLEYSVQLQKLDETLLHLKRKAEVGNATHIQVNGRSMDTNSVYNADSRGAQRGETDIAGQTPKRNHLVNITPQTNQMISQNGILQLSPELTSQNQDYSNKIHFGPPMQTLQVPSSKRQRITGFLGIQVNEDALNVSNSNHGLQTSMTPINNKIKSISLDTLNPNDCKDQLRDLQTQFSLNEYKNSGTMHDPIVLDLSDEE